MKARKCDVCGSVYGENENISLLMIVPNKIGNSTFDERYTFDLCEDCKDKIMDMFRKENDDEA